MHQVVKFNTSKKLQKQIIFMIKLSIKSVSVFFTDFYELETAVLIFQLSFSSGVTIFTLFYIGGAKFLKNRNPRNQVTSLTSI